MLVGSRFRASGSLPAIVHPQWSSLPRFSRSISSLRPRIYRFESPYDLNRLTFDNPAWKRSSIYGSRLNSTSAGVTVAASLPASDNAPDPVGTVYEPGITDLSELSGVDIASIPEKIGYLKDLGLDYGWGPAALMEYIMEHIHIWSGMPWWASVFCTGVLIRLSLLYMMMGASNNAALLHNLKPEMRPLNERVMYLMKKGDNVGALQAREELSALKKKHGIQTWKTFAPFIQAPLGYGVFRTVYGMAALPVPALANESVLWLTDLAVSDPYYILPATSSYLLYYSMKKGGESGTNDLSGTGVWNVIIRAFPAISFVVMQSMPAVLQLYFVGTGLFGVSQAILFNNDNFRRLVGLTIANKNVGESDLKRMLRMIDEQRKAGGGSGGAGGIFGTQAAQPARAAKPATQDISFIDTTINKVKRKISSAGEEFDKLKRETSEKINEYTGSSPTKRADGSPADPPKYSEGDLRDAEDYEKRRTSEEQYKREERNQVRRLKYMGR